MDEFLTGRKFVRYRVNVAKVTKPIDDGNHDPNSERALENEAWKYKKIEL